MNIFNSYYNDNLEILSEKSTGQGDLYHATSIQNVLNMLKEDKVSLTFQSGAEEFLAKKGKLFFLSTSRVKYGKYVHGGNAQHEISRNLATVNISKDALRKYGIPFSDADYWGDEFKKLPNYREEQEVRIYHDMDNLSPLSQFVDSFHICLGFNSEESQIPERKKEWFTDIYYMAKERNMPCYFYTTDQNSSAYKGQFTQKAVPNLLQFLDKLDVVQVRSDEDRVSDEKYSRLRSERPDQMENIWNVYTGNVDSSNSQQDSLLNTLLYYPRDAYLSLETDFHNAFRHHSPVFQRIAAEMKRLKLHSTREFIEHLIKTVQDRGDPKL